MESHIQCPECRRNFSDHLVKFPMFLDDADQTKAYFICPLCAAEMRSLGADIVDPAKLFSSEHSRGLYREALAEDEKNGKPEKGTPMNKEDIILVSMTKLSTNE